MKISPQYKMGDNVIKDIFMPSCGVKKGKLVIKARQSNPNNILASMLPPPEKALESAGSVGHSIT
jgi:hypothetical protein